MWSTKIRSSVFYLFSIFGILVVDVENEPRPQPDAIKLFDWWWSMLGIQAECSALAILRYFSLGVLPNLNDIGGALFLFTR